MRPCRTTAVENRKSVKKAFQEYLAARRPEAVDEAVWNDLLGVLAPVSESYLRELVRATGLPFQQPWAGVRQHTAEELEASLQEILQVYEKAVGEGNRPLARYCRKQVIAARERARFAASNAKLSPEARELKAEMSDWMLVWLENPPVFPAWLEARRNRSSA
jgi:hypothetical protein